MEEKKELTQFSSEWVELKREQWRTRPLEESDLKCYRINYDIPCWAEYSTSLPFGAALAIERLCCEVERLQALAKGHGQN